MEILSKSTQDTQKLASELALKVRPKDIIFLYGDLGSGKTTFVSAFVSSLGIEKRVQSPTFIIHRVYEHSNKIRVNHLDLYRVTTLNELEDLNIHEIFEEENSICFVEWPQILHKTKWEKTAKKIFLEYLSENERIIKVERF